jgi:hypothetical protein
VSTDGSDVSTVAALRAASIIAALQGVAHTTMFLRAEPSHGPAEWAVVDAMRSHAFDFAGSMRSYWDMYFGYGLMAALVVFAEAVLLWRLANGAGQAPQLVRSVIVVLLGYTLIHAALAARYFFVTPIVLDLIVGACLVAALLGPKHA